MKIIRQTTVAMLAMLCAATESQAQEMRVATIGYLVQRELLFADGNHRQTGSWFGVEGSIALGRLSLGASGLFGSLAGAPDQLLIPDADVRVSTLALGVDLASWIELGAIAEARRTGAPAGVAVWRLLGPRLRMRTGLGLPRLEATADVSYFASASVLGSTRSLSPALRTVVGVSYGAPAIPLVVALEHRFERFDFAAGAGAGARLEQFSGLQLRASVVRGAR